jgi:hypothetical protein
MSAFTLDQLKELGTLLEEAYPAIATSAAVLASGHEEDKAVSYLVHSLRSISSDSDVQLLEGKILEKYPRWCRKLLFDIELEDLPRLLTSRRPIKAIISSWRLSQSA